MVCLMESSDIFTCMSHSGSIWMLPVELQTQWHNYGETGRYPFVFITAIKTVQYWLRRMINQERCTGKDYNIFVSMESTGKKTSATCIRTLFVFTGLQSRMATPRYVWHWELHNIWKQNLLKCLCKTDERIFSLEIDMLCTRKTKRNIVWLKPI